MHEKVSIIGVNYLSDSVSKDFGELENGRGVGGLIGVGVNTYLAFEFSLFETRHDLTMNNDVELEGGTFDLKLSLPIEDLDVIEPFIFFGAGKYVLEYPDAKYRGNVDKVYQFTEGGEVHRTYVSFLSGYQFGAGIDVYIIPEISLSSSNMDRRMEFDRDTPNGQELRATVRTLALGVKFHFQ